MDNNNEVVKPQMINEIVIRMFPGQTILDCFVETEQAYERLIQEAPGYGEVEHLIDFVRVFVAPTYNAVEVKNYLERTSDG